MSEGLKSMSNALGNLARMKQHGRRVELLYEQCMNIMKGYDLVRVPLQQHVPSKPVKPYVPESPLGKWYGGPTIDFEKDMDKYK